MTWTLVVVSKLIIGKLWVYNKYLLILLYLKCDLWLYAIISLQYTDTQRLHTTFRKPFFSPATYPCVLKSYNKAFIWVSPNTNFHLKRPFVLGFWHKGHLANHIQTKAKQSPQLVLWQALTLFSSRKFGSCFLGGTRQQLVEPDVKKMILFSLDRLTPIALSTIWQGLF